MQVRRYSMGISEESTIQLKYYRVLPDKYASRLDDNFRRVTVSIDYSYKLRKKRNLDEFIDFCDANQLFIESGGDLSYAFSAWQEAMLGKCDKRVETLKSDTRALRAILISLAAPKIDGLPYIKKLPPTLRFSSSVFTSTKEAQNKVLGEFSITSIQDNTDTSLTLLLETDVDSFISHLISEMRKHRDIIKKISIKYLDEATDRLSFTEEVVEDIPPSTFDSVDLLHSTLKAKGTGQRLSLFSDSLPNEDGYKNLIAFLYHRNNGIIHSDFPGSKNHLSRFTNQYQLREHFGISTLSAVAACNIIIIESGINVDSLRKLQVTATGSIANIYEPTNNGFKINYHKRRAKSYKKRTLKHTGKEAPKIETAFNYLIDATRHHRSMLSGKDKLHLFICDSSKEYGLPRKMSDLPFKSGMVRLLLEARQLISDNPDWCEGITVEDIDQVIKHAPTAKKLRTTEGILRWYDSGGNPAVAAKYLGNTESVALRNYIPKELQVAVYSQKIKRFQNVIIASATNGEEYQIEALNLRNEEELKIYLDKLDKRIENWRTLTRTFIKDDINSPSSTNQKVTIDICSESVAILYACHQIYIQAQKTSKETDKTISNVAKVYQSLILYAKSSSGDRRLTKIIQRGISIYDANIDDFANINLVKGIVSGTH